MQRYLFRFFVIIITILTANLVTNAIGNWLVTFRHHMKPVVFTFVGMGVTVVIFYPLFIRLEEWVKRLSIKLLKSGKKIWGRFFGFLFAFLIALLVLFWFYAKMWYNLDFIKILFSGNLKNYM